MTEAVNETAGSIQARRSILRRDVLLLHAAGRLGLSTKSVILKTNEPHVLVAPLLDSLNNLRFPFAGNNDVKQILAQYYRTTYPMLRILNTISVRSWDIDIAVKEICSVLECFELCKQTLSEDCITAINGIRPDADIDDMAYDLRHAFRAEASR